MKSLLEFYNELPESAQSIISYNCSAWFDPDAPCGLIKPLFDGTMEPDAFWEYAQKSGSGQLDLSYETLWKSIIRPPRDEYDLEQLGDNKFFHKGKTYIRHDYE